MGSGHNESNNLPKELKTKEEKSSSITEKRATNPIKKKALKPLLGCFVASKYAVSSNNHITDHNCGFSCIYKRGFGHQSSLNISFVYEIAKKQYRKQKNAQASVE